MMRACFADNADLPLTCSLDIGEPWNCQWAMQGRKRDDCPFWKPVDAIVLALDILGDARPYGNDTDKLYEACDKLYQSGWIDRRNHRDFDPRGNAEWQVVVDMFYPGGAESW